MPTYGGGALRVARCQPKGADGASGLAVVAAAPVVFIAEPSPTATPSLHAPGALARGTIRQLPVMGRPWGRTLRNELAPGGQGRCVRACGHEFTLLHDKLCGELLRHGDDAPSEDTERTHPRPHSPPVNRSKLSQPKMFGSNPLVDLFLIRMWRLETSCASGVQAH